ncbi:MAG: hypothetical protein GTO62_20015 [Planctomycetales bacterium]|nr:hypothetical protein [Planctomycetales bacterium]NIP71463.1 hypothetical protein [Planctomycetales bacterium]
MATTIYRLATTATPTTTTTMIATTSATATATAIAVTAVPSSAMATAGVIGDRLAAAPSRTATMLAAATAPTGFRFLLATRQGQPHDRNQHCDPKNNCTIHPEILHTRYLTCDSLPSHCSICPADDGSFVGRQILPLNV